MLSPADRDLVRRDTVVPGLATVLDPDAFGIAIAAVIGQPISKATITYVRYKPRRSCLVGYRLQTADSVVEVTAKASRPDAAALGVFREGRTAFPGALRFGRLWLSSQTIVVAEFPNDERLRVLPLFADNVGRNRLLMKLLPERPDLWAGHLTQLRYKPERRYVARLDVAGQPRAVLKAYAPAGYTAAQANSKSVLRRPAVRIPARLGRSARHGVVAHEWLDGRLLSEALADPSFDVTAVRAVGETLAKLHQSAGDHLPTRTAAGSANLLPPLIGWISHVVPSLASAVRELGESLMAKLLDGPESFCQVHGDFYSKQVVLGAVGVGVIDFDEAFRGDPANDLGLFIAHLVRDAIRGTIAPSRVGPVTRALLDGYEDAAGRLPGQVGHYVAVGLLRLMPHPFRNREPDWPARTAAMLDRAAAWLRDANPVAQSAGAAG